MSKKQSDNRYTPASYKQANSSGSATKSLKSKKAMIISLIAIVAVAVIVVSLVLALWKEVIPSNIESTRPDGDTSSSLDISNSDFKYTYADAQNLQYPLTATSWTKRDSVVDSDTLMGVVDTKEDEWNGKVVYDLGQKGLNNTTNPGYPVADSENSRIFMISNAEETAASVLLFQRCVKPIPESFRLGKNRLHHGARSLRRAEDLRQPGFLRLLRRENGKHQHCGRMGAIFLLYRRSKEHKPDTVL